MPETATTASRGAKRQRGKGTEDHVQRSKGTEDEASVKDVAPPPASARRKTSAKQVAAAVASTSSSSSATATATNSKILELHQCPITRQLLVDPVVAQDGHLYERSAIQRWLTKKQTSPVTNKAMGSELTTAVVARQTVNELVDGGHLADEALVAFLISRGQLRSTRSLPPGPDLDGAEEDFHRAAKLAQRQEDKENVKLQLNTVEWIRELGRLFEQAKRVFATAPGAPPSQDLRDWCLKVGDVVRTGIIAPEQAGRLTEWRILGRGTKVVLVDDVEELRKLCERPAPGAANMVGWTSQMECFAGCRCIVVRNGEVSHMNYVLRREGALPPVREHFSFPYDALLSVVTSRSLP